jgi:hypothetical protein
MTGSTPATPAPGNWIPLPPRLLPTLAVALLLGSSAAAAPEPDGASGESYALGGRSRFEMRFGISNVYVSHDQWSDALDVAGGDFALGFVHWPHENLALDLSLGATNLGVSRRWTRRGERVRAEGLYRVMAGARFYLPVKGAFRPHVDLAGGLLTEIDVHDSPWNTDVTGRTAKAGLEVGGGVDFLLGHHFVVGVRAGTLVRDGYKSELNAGGSLGWAFGGRH